MAQSDTYASETPKFPKSEVYVEVSHNEHSVGKTEKVFVEDIALIPLEAKFEYSYKIVSEQNLDELLSNPIYFSLWEKLVPAYNALALVNNRKDIHQSDISIYSSEEPILGIKDLDTKLDVDGEVRVKIKKKIKNKPKGKKGKKLNTPKSNTKKTSKSSDPKSNTKKTSISSDPKFSKTMKKISANITPDDEIIMVGSGNLDLSPLFLGETTISETILMYPKQIRIDSKVIHDPFLPKLAVKICLDKPIFNKNADEKFLYNMLYLTMESIFNLPTAFTEDMEYKVATVFPTENLGFSNVCFENGKYRDEYDFWLNNKFWPNKTHIDNFGGVTKQTISRINPNKLKTDLNINVKEIVENDTLRITWNCVKQSWLTEDANDMLRKSIIKHRKWPIEIMIRAGEKQGPHGENKKGKKLDSSSQGDTEQFKKNTKQDKSLSRTESKMAYKVLRNTDFFHYMALPDISMLLYPGVTKVRVACEIRSFNIHEYTTQTGITSSFFDPYLHDFMTKSDKKATFSSSQLEEVFAAEDKKAGGKKGDKLKEDKRSKKSLNKRRNETKRDRASKISLRQSIDIEPSYALCNVYGEPTFLIFEIELKTPFQQRRTIEDLTAELQTIIPTRDICAKSPPPIQIATELYDRTVNAIIAELNTEYQKYWRKEKGVCNNLSTPIFLRHLKGCGIYEKFITSTERAIALLVKEKYKFEHNPNSNYAHDIYVSTVYVNVVSRMNKLLNTTLTCPFANCNYGKSIEKSVLLSVREAEELNIPGLAQRYLLETLARNPKSPEYWFHLAVFYKYQKDIERALEAVKEALILDSKFKYGLLLCGVILYEQKQIYLAEAAFLSLLTHYPDFLFGWVVLYMVYYIEGKSDGADVCMENMKEYQDTADICSNESILKTDPLGWTVDLCDKTAFMKTAMILIQIFALKLAEMALILDQIEPTAIHKYYFGVIYFEKRNYIQALEYGLTAQRIYGPGYTINSLIGHCYNRLGRFKEAKEAYNFAIDVYNRPDDLHMMHFNLALLYEKEDKLEKAKKFLLLVCKFSPTPYSWLRLGIIFYKQKNLVEAEGCLTESNCLDNRMSETWAYLTLVNLKNNNIWEARQSYTQMLKYPLEDKDLSLEVQGKIETIME